MSEEPTNDGEDQTSLEPESETAPEQKEKVTFNEDQQAVIDKVGHQGRENVRAERQKSADLQRQLDEAQAKIPVEQRPNVATVGDVYDENYETQRTQREAQIRAQATFDAKATWDAEAVETAQIAKQQVEKNAYDEAVNKFNSSATKFGIDQSALANMGQTIGNYGGLTPEVSNFVINDEQGMLIFQHMASNPEDIYAVNNMSPMQAGVFLTDIKAKQSAINIKKTSDAPDPADRPSGGGVDTDSGKLVYSKGAVYS